jgi:hypothetical protein
VRRTKIKGFGEKSHAKNAYLMTETAPLFCQFATNPAPTM